VSAPGFALQSVAAVAATSWMKRNAGMGATAPVASLYMQMPAETLTLKPVPATHWNPVSVHTSRYVPEPERNSSRSMSAWPYADHSAVRATSAVVGHIDTG